MAYNPSYSVFRLVPHPLCWPSDCPSYPCSLLFQLSPSRQPYCRPFFSHSPLAKPWKWMGVSWSGPQRAPHPSSLLGNAATSWEVGGEVSDSSVSPAHLRHRAEISLPSPPSPVFGHGPRGPGSSVFLGLKRESSILFGFIYSLSPTIYLLQLHSASVSLVSVADILSRD